MIFFTFPTLPSLSSQFPTMQSFASLQQCMLSLAFQSIYPILLWHIQGFLLLQARILPFWVPLNLQSLSSSRGTLPLSSFLFPLLLHQLVQQYHLPFVFFSYNYVWSSCLYNILTIDIPQYFHFFILCCSCFSNSFFLQSLHWTFFTTL